MKFPSDAKVNITLRDQNQEAAAFLAREFGFSNVTSRVLAARGIIEPQSVRQFLAPSLKEGLISPYQMVDLAKACELIEKSLNHDQKIAIALDYDVDGLSAGAILYNFLKQAGGNVYGFVPDRFSEGYGLNKRIVEEAQSLGCNLLVCVDFGTHNREELDLCRKLNIKTIVIDHHQLGDSAHPKADAFLNPCREDCGFAGRLMSAAGLVWYLLLGLKDSVARARGIDPKNFLDLAALGTVCDMVPLIGINRVIARRGLELLANSERVGIKALIKAAGLSRNLKSSDLSFVLGPRINAAGRINNASNVFELLTTVDSERASLIARSLNDLNSERQKIEAKSRDHALVAAQKLISADVDGCRRSLVICDDGYHIGVIGIIAQRLVEHFYLPSAVIGFDHDGSLKGSVRGVQGFSVIKALSQAKDHLIKYGGHESAGGFSLKVEELEAFQKSFEQAARDQLGGTKAEIKIEADTEVKLSEIDELVVKEFEKFSPFGIGNPAPCLFSKRARVIELKTLKDLHLKVKLSDGSHKITALLWGKTEHPELKVGNIVDFAFRADCSYFGGIPEVQANLQAVRKTL
ncbi:MAG TPA: single-stranded-DNA-specific exonuclease RecJ [Oligoflexia bacterium]|nr:single-stranded-DNA-specific exonuclease RecJ [Oligoflexia bacterium]HMP26854.1 single-stranded-DNA-specific exonuclease RecJ [Oligoflexia bacterium]